MVHINEFYIYMKFLLLWIKYCKNWYYRILISLGIVESEIIYLFRNGLNILTRPGKYDHASIINIIFLNWYKINRKEIETKPVIIDVGAHIGVFSLFLSTFDNESQIYAFEPIPDTYTQLKKNIMINHLEDIINIYPYALSGKSGLIDIYISNEDQNASIYHLDSDVNKIQVESFSLDDFINNSQLSNIDIIKLNCEGAEIDILRNCSDSTWGIINRILISFHETDNNLDTNAQYLMNLLKLKKFHVSIDKRHRVIHGKKIVDD